ncbi:MAG: DUF2244 domain-containing protein, partial [Rhodobacteraceae bacterium]|nr:DUF2244 domain-containing protein [Paracoccaceae bacterium]
ALGQRGFVTFIALTALLLALPLLALVGNSALWVVFAFIAPTVWAIWTALRRNSRDLGLTEELLLTRSEARLVRRTADGEERVWSANPYWLRVTLYPTEGPVADYLTLTGGDREVELGAFLAPEERKALAAELRAVLAALK